MTINITNQSPHQSRKQWQKLAFQWLETKKDYHDFDFDSCLRKIESNPVSMEPALAAFWIAYVPDQLPFNMTEEQEKTIRSILMFWVPLTREDAHAGRAKISEAECDGKIDGVHL